MPVSLSDAQKTATAEYFAKITDFSSVVVVVVGSAEKQYLIHRDLLTSQSSFFRAALDNSWKEAGEGRVKLPEEETKAFDIFIRWLYFDHIPPLEHSQVFTEAYLLGNKLQAPEFKNDVIDAVVTWSDAQQKLPGLQPIKRLYEGTLPKDKMRQLIVDLYLWDGYKDVHPEFLHEFANALLQRGHLRVNPNEAPYKKDVHIYHVVPDGHLKCCVKPENGKEA